MWCMVNCTAVFWDTGQHYFIFQIMILFGDPLPLSRAKHIWMTINVAKLKQKVANRTCTAIDMPCRVEVPFRVHWFPPWTATFIRWKRRCGIWRRCIRQNETSNLNVGAALHWNTSIVSQMRSETARTVTFSWFNHSNNRMSLISVPTSVITGTYFSVMAKYCSVIIPPHDGFIAGCCAVADNWYFSITNVTLLWCTGQIWLATYNTDTCMNWNSTVIKLSLCWYIFQDIIPDH